MPIWLHIQFRQLYLTDIVLAYYVLARILMFIILYAKIAICDYIEFFRFLYLCFMVIVSKIIMRKLQNV